MAKRNPKEVEAIVSGMGVFTTIISNLVEIVKKFGGTMESIYRLATPEGNKTLEAIAQLIVNGVVKSEFFRLIPGSQALVLDATEGTENFSGAQDVFDYIDPGFKNRDADEPGNPTGEMKVEIHEMTKNGTFPQLFGSLSSDVGKLCHTPGQVKNFVRKYRGWLRTEGCATFFPFQANGRFFVALVSFFSDDSLRVSVFRFELDYVWGAESRHRVVVPQLA
jgi:hypothetical protein